MKRRTMAEPPMPRMGSVWPVLPNFRVGNLPLLSSIDFSAGAAALATRWPRAVVPAAASRPDLRKSRRSKPFCESRMTETSAMWAFGCEGNLRRSARMEFTPPAIERPLDNRRW